MGNTFRVAPVYTPGELAERVNAYIDLERGEERESETQSGTGRQKESNAQEKQPQAPPPPKRDPWRYDPRLPRKEDERHK